MEIETSIKEARDLYINLVMKTTYAVENRLGSEYTNRLHKLRGNAIRRYIRRGGDLDDIIDYIQKIFDLGYETSIPNQL